MANTLKSFMPRLGDFSAVIFDMDGLVLDTETTFCIAWRQAARALGYELSMPYCRSLAGSHYNDVELKLMAFCGDDFNLEVFNDKACNYWRDYVNRHGIKIKRGFTQLLECIVKQQIPYCLATNSRAVNTYECLQLAGIADVFSNVITRDDVHYGKPAPDIFLKAAKLLDVDIRRCMVIEDSDAGIMAASRAGAFSVFVPSVFPVDPLTVELCDLKINNLACLLELN
ncbi:MAG: HAD family phosphatase [Methylococcales bacterium]|nr:HAD family phosphatase [Methylococcales bacterium]